MSDDDESRRSILARRARFVRLAIAGAATVSTATACACLQPQIVPDTYVPSEDAGTDAPDAGPDARP